MVGGICSEPFGVLEIMDGRWDGQGISATILTLTAAASGLAAGLNMGLHQAHRPVNHKGSVCFEQRGC